jgi:hypothetical protein
VARIAVGMVVVHHRTVHESHRAAQVHCMVGYNRLGRWLYELGMMARVKHWPHS